MQSHQAELRRPAGFAVHDAEGKKPGWPTTTRVGRDRFVDNKGGTVEGGTPRGLKSKS